MIYQHLVTYSTDDIFGCIKKNLRYIKKYDQAAAFRQRRKAESCMIVGRLLRDVPSLSTSGYECYLT